MESNVIIELSLNSVLALSMLRTMKLNGIINDTQVTMLIDCDATNNFIGLDLVETLKIILINTTSYGVVMGTRVAKGGEYAVK